MGPLPADRSQTKTRRVRRGTRGGGGEQKDKQQSVLAATARATRTTSSSKFFAFPDQTHPCSSQTDLEGEGCTKWLLRETHDGLMSLVLYSKTCTIGDDLSKMPHDIIKETLW